MTEVVSRNELANQLGVSLPTVDSWVRRGCPILKPGRRGVAAQFDLRAVRGWVDRYISTGRVVRHEGQTFQLPSNEEALLIKAYGYIISQHYGYSAEVGHVLGLSPKDLFALEMTISLHLAKCMETFLHERGISDQSLDYYNKPNTELDWKKLTEQHGEKYSESEFDKIYWGEWEEHYDNVRKRVVQLPRGGEN